jgi:hypothetical protein
MGMLKSCKDFAMRVMPAHQIRPGKKKQKNAQ